MDILIFTQTEDTHATVVARALTHLGHRPHLWFGTDVPQAATMSMALDDRDAFRLFLDGPDTQLQGSVDRVWLRRPTLAVLPEAMHPEDARVSGLEWQAFLYNMLHGSARDAFWVNDWRHAERARRKVVQLTAARRVGLTVPPTLISNDPQRIRDFIPNATGTDRRQELSSSAMGGGRASLGLHVGRDLGRFARRRGAQLVSGNLSAPDPQSL